jgi:hypothetical protein
MTFRVRQKIVCIGGFVESDYACSLAFGTALPVANSIYTVAAFRTDRQFIELLEIPPVAPGRYVAFCPSRFRPLLDDEIKISFTHGADPSSDQFDNRRVKVGESA